MSYCLPKPLVWFITPYIYYTTTAIYPNIISCLCEVFASYWSTARLQQHCEMLAPNPYDHILKSNYIRSYCFNGHLILKLNIYYVWLSVSSLPLWAPGLIRGKDPVRMLLKTGSARSSSSDPVSLSHQGTTPAMPHAPPGPEPEPGSPS